MSDCKKFNEQVPSKETIYSYLTGKNISGKDYEHAFNVWNKIGMKTMKYHHDLHLKCDVLLLADVLDI